MNNDTAFEDKIIERVEEHPGRGWSVGFDRACSFFIPDKGVVPLVGDTMRMWGRGFGYPVRGIALNGRVVFYETEDAFQKRMAVEQLERDANDMAKYEAERPEFERRRAALPEVFQRRIDRFRSANPNFGWRFEGYEMMCCESAVAIARALGTVEALETFTSAAYARQVEMVPQIKEAGHSGNSFGMSCRLAYWFLKEPENVVREHGALTPLVGCEDYGCLHPTD